MPVSFHSEITSLQQPHHDLWRNMCLNVFNLFSQVVLCEFLCIDNKAFLQEQQEI